MACCYPDECGEYTVTPMLVSSLRYQTKCSEEPQLCYPCLPACPKEHIVYRCERRQSDARPRTPTYNNNRDECYDTTYRPSDHRQHPRRKSRSPTSRQSRNPSPHVYESCCPPTCKPVKTKYVIPCYRYEDGRIYNQPTVLMRRACEVAVGTRMRRKPFVESSFCSDPFKEEHRYHSEDERGNCCYHFERKKPCTSKCDPDHEQPHARSKYCIQQSLPCQACASCPQCHYVDYVQAKAVGSQNCCYYCD